MDTLWVKRQPRGCFHYNRPPLSDIGVTRTINSAKRKRLQSNIIFRNDSERVITDGDRISFSVDGDRMYFIGDSDGYKLVRLRRTSRMSACACDLSEFVGNYDLMYDVKRKLYYIDKRWRIKHEVSN